MSDAEGRDRTGRPAGNPPGLTEIAYRTGDFATFRHALLAPLPGEQQLAGWSPRPGDLGLQALEWWAYLADILTFYNERIANGSYLRTAAAQPGPQNAAALAALLGYRAAPAVTATGVIAAIRGAGAADGTLAIPAGPGMQIMSTPSDGAPAQVFEVTTARAFAGPSDAVIGLPPDPTLFAPPAAQDPATARTVLLAGQVTVSVGDQLVLVRRDWDGTSADWSVVSVQAAAAGQDPGGAPSTRLTLSSADWHGLAGGAAGYQLQRAPSTAHLWTMPASAGTPQAAATPQAATPQAAGTLTVPLATLVRNLSPGDNVLFTGSTGGAAPRSIQLLAQVTGYAEQVTQAPAVAASGTTSSGTTASSRPDVYISRTNLTVRTTGADADLAALRSAIGAQALGGIAVRYGFRDVGNLVPPPAQALDSLPVTVTVPAGLKLPADGSPVALQDANGTGLLVTAVATGTPGTVTLGPPPGGPTGALDRPLRAPVRLLADLVPVSRGTTAAAEVLGDGDPSVAGQAFTLQYAPLVYLPPAAPGGDPVSTLSVTVNGVPWREVPAFAGQQRDAAVYVTSELPDGTTQVRFGDGVDGARLPPGAGNVTATYRYGAPAPPPPAGTLTTVLQPQPNLGSVVNPVDIVPGTAPEPASATAAAAPASAVALPGAASAFAPLISVRDGERIAATVSGVNRVRAYWTWDTGLRCPAITIYLASDTDAGTAAAVTAAGRLFPRGASRVPLTAAPARAVALAVRCQLLCAPGADTGAVHAAATAALAGPGGLFSPRRMAIGQRLYRSEVEAALMVAGVTAVLGLHVRWPGRDEQNESVFHPAQDGYFTVPGDDLAVSVVTR